MRETSLKPKSINLKQQNKSPLSGYYGGKYKMSNLICSMIPPHETYIEPFFGGGSIFFLKKKSPVEIINDKDILLYVFWKTCKSIGYKLSNLLKETSFSQEDYDYSKKLLKDYKNNSEEDIAKQVFINLNTSFSNQFKNSYRKKIHIKTIKNKAKIIEYVQYRMKNTSIKNDCGINIINKNKENDKAFFYIDPPYPEADQRYNCKFSIKDFKCLLQSLEKIKGKFLVSCYLKDWMIMGKNWNVRSHKVFCYGDNQKKKQKRTEALIYNF